MAGVPICHGAHCAGLRGTAAMNQSEQLDTLIRSGWRIWQKHSNGWVTLSRYNAKEVHHFLNPGGREYVTCFNQGRIASGIVYPRKELN